MGDNSTPHAPAEGGANQAGSFSIAMKPPLTYEQQIDLMQSRGLIFHDVDDAAAKLSRVNYYRLRGYWLTYERDGMFIPGTTFGDIWDTYLFDADIRELLWSLISPIEIKARTSFAYRMSHGCGPLSHEDASLFKSGEMHARSMASLKRETDRAVRDGVPCVTHNIEKYGDLPIWAAVEVMSMGTVSQLYGNLDQDACHAAREIASDFGVKPFMLRSWLRHLTYIRNICGHHSRLYNRVMTTRPRLIKTDAKYDSNKEFPTLMVLKRIYEKSWPEEWDNAVERLCAITERHDRVDLRPMGFPDDWKGAL